MHKILYITIGVTLFILIIGCAFLEFCSNGSDETEFSGTNDLKVGEIIYKGKFPIPVENFTVVTSGFGSRKGGGIF